MFTDEQLQAMNLYEGLSPADYSGILMPELYRHGMLPGAGVALCGYNGPRLAFSEQEPCPECVIKMMSIKGVTGG